MNSASRNVRRTLSRLVGLRRTPTRERHLAVEDDVRRIDRMRVVGVERIGAVLPDIHVSKPFLVQLPFEFVGGHKQFASSASRAVNGYLAVYFPAPTRLCNSSPKFCTKTTWLRCVSASGRSAGSNATKRLPSGEMSRLR